MGVEVLTIINRRVLNALDAGAFCVDFCTHVGFFPRPIQ